MLATTIMGLHPSSILNKATLPLNNNTRESCDIDRVIEISRLRLAQSARLFRLRDTLAATWVWLQSTSTGHLSAGTLLLRSPRIIEG